MLGEIEAVCHIICSGISRIEWLEAKRRLAKFDQAHVGVKHIGDISAFSIRTEHRTTHARPVAELCPIAPLFYVRRLDVIEPAAPVVPGDEDSCAGPESTLDNSVDLSYCPRLSLGNDFPGMFAQASGCVDPRDGWQVPCRCIHRELLKPDTRTMSPQTRNEVECIPPVVPPVKPGTFQAGRERWQIEWWLQFDGVSMVGIVDQWRVSSYEHEVVRGRWTSYLGKVVVAQCELLRIGEVGRDIFLGVLLASGFSGAL